MSDLRNQIGNLSVAEQLELTDAQREELDYRMARYEQNPANVIPWEQVRAGLFKKQ